MQIFQHNYEYISNDTKHDTNIFPKSLHQFCVTMKKKLRTLRCVIVITETPRKEVKAFSVLQRQWEICQKLKINILVTNFAPHHAKYLYDPAGKRWVQWYNIHCVGELGADADDIEKVAIYMNKTFSEPKKKKKGRG